MGNIITTIIALDVYGTILSSQDWDNELPPRTGFREFVKNVQDLGILLVTSSDAPIDTLKINLGEGFKKINLSLDIFDDFYKLSYYPKDFSEIISNYKIEPRQLFVIGDQYDKDIIGASRLGCNTFQIPEYRSFPDNFDFSSIKIQ